MPILFSVLVLAPASNSSCTVAVLPKERGEVTAVYTAKKDLPAIVANISGVYCGERRCKGKDKA